MADKKHYFELIIGRDEHYYLILRFCNLFVDESFWEYHNEDEKYSLKVYFMYLGLPKIWKSLRYKIKQIIESHQYETFVKIKMCIEYCKFLLTLNKLSADNSDILSNYEEFLVSIQLCLRIMKKLYSLKVKKYIPFLKSVIKQSISIYSNYLPQHKMKGLTKLDELMNKGKKHVKI